MRHAESAGIPRDTAWSKLTPEQKHWVIEGTPSWEGNWNKQWYGIRRFFAYLESKAYKMHIRVLCPSTAATPLPQLRRRAAEDRIAAVAGGHEGRCRCGAGAGAALHAAGRGVDARAAGGAAGAVPAR
jgi:hypothetical protein